MGLPGTGYAGEMADFDAIVIGMGPGGEVAAGRLMAAGKTVAVVERELIGGECAYWAGIPSKTLLRRDQVCAVPPASTARSWTGPPTVTASPGADAPPTERTAHGSHNRRRSTLA